MDRLDPTPSQFYGFAYDRVGILPAREDRELVHGEVPIADYPPTYHVTTGAARLHERLPQLSDVLGVLATVSVRYHEPYVNYDGDLRKGPPGMDAKPNPANAMFVVESPYNTDLRKRLYKLVSDPDTPGHARGTRIDFTVRREVLHDAAGMHPDIAYTEWEQLMALAGVIRTSLTEGGERTPQEGP